jgi:predicted Zn-dependent protease
VVGLCACSHRLHPEEVRLANLEDRNVAAMSTLLVDEALHEQLDRIGRRIAAVTEYPDLDWRFRVVSDAGVNAFTPGGGIVYVTTGMLDLLESEDELAAVLGHEIGHVTQSHPCKSVASQHRTKIAATSAMILMAVAAGAAAAYAVPPGYYAYDHYHYQQQMAVQMAQLAVVTSVVMMNAAIEGHSRAQELEADEYALVYAKAAGYDPNGLVTTFERMMDLQLQADGGRGTHFLNAKPGLEKRLEKARKALAQSD